MIVTNTDYVPGREVKESLGVVRGNTIRAKHFGKDIVAGLRNVLGGEIKEYTEMFTEARDEAMERMEKEAEEKEADAIVNVRFVTAEISQRAAEILCYGTAVKLE